MSKGITKKVRRHSGWVTPNLTFRCKRQEIIDNCLEPHPYWDDWTDYRDGMRSLRDNTKIKYQHLGSGVFFHVATFNKKNKKMLNVRRAKRKGRFVTNFEMPLTRNVKRWKCEMSFNGKCISQYSYGVKCDGAKVSDSCTYNPEDNYIKFK